MMLPNNTVIVFIRFLLKHRPRELSKGLGFRQRGESFLGFFELFIHSLILSKCSINVPVGNLPDLSLLS